MKYNEIVNMLWSSLGNVEKGLILLTVALYVLLSLYAPTRGQVSEGLSQGARSLVRVSLLLVAATFLGGLIGALLPRDVIAQVIGGESGLKGILVGVLLGSLIPGGPYVYLPIAAALYSSGAGIASIVALIFAKSVTNIPFIPYFLAYLTPVNAQRVIYITVLLGIPVPFVMGLVSWLLSK